MNTIKELAEAIRNGTRPIVTFQGKIADKEAYPEPGMRARIIGVADEKEDDVIKLLVDYSEFDADNVPFESFNYYDKRHCPVLNARQAGFYKPQESLYFDTNEAISDTMVVASNVSLLWFERYKASGSPLLYVQWLESELDAATKY